ncbi:hypothetical protein U9M48_007850 [Paspalum notatum var. saurae]|uniref:HAT C-terminal dimerisation domain-containing protein n=1 Tax=Paspalum notatum var. saurae TaxID=547442 RepID=A0AAQ3SMY6_PASNO
MVKLFRVNPVEKNIFDGKGKLLHYHCGRVLNLTCKVGFGVINPIVYKIENPIVYKIRKSVKIIEGSTSRKQKFEGIIQQLEIAYQKRPKIDVSTRCDSIYLMLETYLQLRIAFESFAKQDPEYTFVPSNQKWENVRMLCGFLKTFYEEGSKVSHYPTKTWEFAFVEFHLKQLFGSEADSKMSTMKKGYSQVSLGSQDMSQQVASAEVVTNATSRYAYWDHHISGASSPRSEIDTFDILAWWKSNSSEYPTLSRMGRDILVFQLLQLPQHDAFSIDMLGRLDSIAIYGPLYFKL